MYACSALMVSKLYPSKHFDSVHQRSGFATVETKLYTSILCMGSYTLTISHKHRRAIHGGDKETKTCTNQPRHSWFHASMLHGS